MHHLVATLALFPPLLLGCGEKSTSTDTAASPEESSEAVDAATVYMSFCSGCHASDGTGASGPSLTDSIPMIADADLMDILQNGVGYMAAPSLTEAEEDALFLYLRDRFGDYGGAR